MLPTLAPTAAGTIRAQATSTVKPTATIALACKLQRHYDLSHNILNCGKYRTVPVIYNASGKEACCNSKWSMPVNPVVQGPCSNRVLQWESEPRFFTIWLPWLAPRCSGSQLAYIGGTRVHPSSDPPLLESPIYVAVFGAWLLSRAFQSHCRNCFQPQDGVHHVTATCRGIQCGSEEPMPQ